MAGISGGCGRRNADGPALSLPNRRSPVHLDDAALGRMGRCSVSVGSGAETIRIEHLLAGQVQRPAADDVPSWAMLANRSNSTLTSGLVVHDVATTDSSQTDRALWTCGRTRQRPPRARPRPRVTVLDLHGIGLSAAPRLLANVGDIRPPSPGPLGKVVDRRALLVPGDQLGHVTFGQSACGSQCARPARPAELVRLSVAGSRSVQGVQLE